jgi:hypothetical protein
VRAEPASTGRLYRTPSNFPGRYIARCGKSMGPRGGQKETPITPDEPGDPTQVMKWKGLVGIAGDGLSSAPGIIQISGALHPLQIVRRQSIRHQSGRILRDTFLPVASPMEPANCRLCIFLWLIVRAFTWAR